MRILFVADGRSPIAINWIRYWVEHGDDVYLASTYACNPAFPLKGMSFIPVAFSGMKSTTGLTNSKRDLIWGTRTLRLRAFVRQWLGPLTLPRMARKLRETIERVKPDFVHAMRIPYEGMLASMATGDFPLIISVWGNDFTLHASASPLTAHYTRHAMRSTAALHVDCFRDARLAQQWGFPADRPKLVVPGNGGIIREVFYPPSRPVLEPFIINPRGFRAYVRNDTFFRAIPYVLKKCPQAKFVGATMAGDPQALSWVNKLGIQKSVNLLAPVSHSQMGDLFRKARVVVSPSVHDGTPNSLLEGMACGCLPVAGDLESIREWITQGLNGLLIDPTDPQALADGILTAIESPALCAQAAKENARLIAERADYQHCMAQAQAFYNLVLARENKFR